MLTPLLHEPALARAIGIDDLYLKREDLHPYGSHKGRSIPVMIDRYLATGDRRFAISSSGNAALAAALYVKEKLEKGNGQGGDSGIELDIFVGNHVAARKLEKLRKLADERIRIFKKERPLQALAQAAQEGARSLRQSTDDTALIGYARLAEELALGPYGAKTDGPGAIFIGTSSGTTAQALAGYFLKKHGKSAAAGSKISGTKDSACPKINIVQTSSCHPFVDAFETYDGPDELSVADAVTDITALRKPELIPLLEETRGRAWTATNEDIGIARELVKKHAGLDISTNSALSIVGAMKAAYVGHETEGPVVCLICGD